MGKVIKKEFVKSELPKRKRCAGLLTIEEYKILRKHFGFVSSSFVPNINLCFELWVKDGLINPLIITSAESETIISSYSKRKKKVFLDYILLNMVFDRIDINREFIEKYIYTEGFIGLGRFEALCYLYDVLKPSELPNINYIKENKNKWFIISIVSFYKWDALDEETIVVQLLYYYRLHSNRARNLGKRFNEFTQLFYPVFKEYNLMSEKDNVIEYLSKRWANKPIDIVEDVRFFFNNKMGSYTNTEFYDVCTKFIEECLFKKIYDPKRIKVIITHWSQLTGICVEHNITKISEINVQHRDFFALVNISQSHGKFQSIRDILKFYNDVLFEGYDNQKIISLFSSSKLPRKPTNVNHTGIMETGIKALISSVGSEIIQSRLNRFSKLKESEKIHFIHVRLIWLVMLTGARVGEICNLKLDDIKRSFDYKEPYILIKTLKGNNDRAFELHRGEKIGEDRYEFDLIHFEIIKESIEAADNMYHGLEVKDRFLFPNRKNGKTGVASVYSRLIEIQLKNGIVCGSHYDVLNRELYEGMPYLQGKWEKRKALFTTHDLRHAKINWLLLHGGLNKYEIQDYIGHKNINSQDEYQKSTAMMFKVAKMMEEHNHYGAKNELVTPNYQVIDKEVNRKEYVLLKDIDEYLSEFEKRHDRIEIRDAEAYIDKNTACEVIISCSATGISCLGCNDFRAGQYSEEKIDNISRILVEQIKAIDYQINNINRFKRSMISKRGKVILKNALLSLVSRFESIEVAKGITLISNKTGFGMEEARADKFTYHLMLKYRQSDLDKEIIKHIKGLKKNGKFEDINLLLYRSKINRVVFK
ncbi:tyrosine-type recombinase/integrase [Bacillus mycoides]|uniref:tyrosine-type recombinase/integrase n=1 Tax=Bacillus mycoides TaxID=1405 RepID=UPI003D302EBB